MVAMASVTSIHTGPARIQLWLDRQIIEVIALKVRRDLLLSTMASYLLRCSLHSLELDHCL